MLANLITSCTSTLKGNNNSEDQRIVPDDAESTGAGTETKARTENPRIGSKGT